MNTNSHALAAVQGLALCGSVLRDPILISKFSKDLVE
jgi:hypothetical protein